VRITLEARVAVRRRPARRRADPGLGDRAAVNAAASEIARRRVAGDFLFAGRLTPLLERSPPMRAKFSGGATGSSRRPSI